MSVSLASVLTNLNLGPEVVIKGHEGFALAAITGALAREHNQAIKRAPIPANDPIESENPAHALVIGEKTK